MDATGPLTGITVIDLSTGVGGPFCAKLLADYGANVVKIEPPGGDPARRRGPFPTGVAGAEPPMGGGWGTARVPQFQTDAPDPERSAAFLYLNTNKQSIVLDLDQPADRDILLGLVDRADALIESFPPGHLAALGLGWETLRQRRPSLVLTSVTPFGQNGPYAGYKATNLTAYALGGQMAMTGDPDREPLKAGGEQAEYQAGLNAFAATAISLAAALQSGKGDHVDVGAMQCMASVLEASVPLYAYLGLQTGARRGNVMSSLIGIYPCADGYLGVHAMPRNWAPLAEVMEMPHLATDERYATQRARIQHNDELVATLYAWAADQKKKEVYARAGTMRGPIAYVHTLDDLLDSPHLRTRGYFHQIDHPIAGRLTYPGAPFSMSDSPWRAGRAPLLDEHRGVVLERPSPRLPLEGVRVLDLTMVWAGPYATRLLGDMGAEVIKVESTRFWDLLRALGYLPPDTERTWNKSAYFNHNSRDKLGISLDLADPRGRDLLLRLVATCDVVIENYRADVLERLGLDYETLRAAREDIILVSMPGHGKSGPERDYVAYGTNVEQLAGLVSLTGYEGGPPHKSGISYGDPTAGITAAGAVALALIHRRRTGRGQYVELAQRENLTTLIGEEVVAYSMTGRLPDRTGNRDRRYAPHGVYPCGPNPPAPVSRTWGTRTVPQPSPDGGSAPETPGREGGDGSAEASRLAPLSRAAGEGPGEGADAWIAIACTNGEEFAALCRVIGRAELATDSRYQESVARKANEADLDEPIVAWTKQRDHYTAMDELQAAGVPAGAVLSIPELFVDPHLRARGFWEQIAHADAGIWDVDGVAWRLRERPAHIRIPAPRFAEHNEYVYRHLLGLSDAGVAALTESGVIGDTPDLAVHQ